MRKSTLSFGVGVACAVLAGVIGAFALHRALNTETVVVATHTLYPYTRIHKTDVATVTVPKTSGIAGLSTNEATVVGRYLSYSVPKGDPVTAGDLNASGAEFLDLFNTVHGTHRTNGHADVTPCSNTSRVRRQPG
ncbi:SAF domain-containing protein [Alicyclobacillus sp. ALC3]|uniref:SAF domain-containing protein n=1 Tax=Alicyclobacillus sp. ALC3 TaxID=2796143 RepID=UPI002377E5D9|nr:SAF domain-containing protein [Alicyclobacillus sp. ALC3]WDL96747.1 hypothetical protein JC200_21020 [Alicyclobacillus sp. ALC3]